VGWWVELGSKPNGLCRFGVKTRAECHLVVKKEGCVANI
jgi:hypothetical protein